MKDAATHREPPKEKAPGRNCSLETKTHKGAGFLAVAAICGGLMLEQSASEELYHMEITYADPVLKTNAAYGRDSLSLGIRRRWF